jgi:hypothetical protein
MKSPTKKIVIHRVEGLAHHLGVILTVPGPGVEKHRDGGAEKRDGARFKSEWPCQYEGRQHKGNDRKWPLRPGSLIIWLAQLAITRPRWPASARMPQPHMT